MSELSSKMRCNRKRARGCYCARELEDEEGGRVGTGFVLREGGGMRREICVSRLHLNSWKRGWSRLMQTILRSKGIWVRGVAASTGARWSRVGV